MFKNKIELSFNRLMDRCKNILDNPKKGKTMLTQKLKVPIVGLVIVSLLFSACGNGNSQNSSLPLNNDNEVLSVLEQNEEHPIEDETFVDEHELENSQEMGVEEEHEVLEDGSDGLESEEELALLDDGGVI